MSTFVMMRPIHRPIFDPSGGTIEPPPVVHTRAFGTAIVSQVNPPITPSPVIHTRAFGTPLFRLTINPSMPQDTGFKAARVVDQGSTASVDWVNVISEAIWNDDVDSISVTLSPSNFSERLRAKSLGLMIPAGATIVGIEEEITINAVPGGSYDFYPGLTEDGTTVDGQKYDDSPSTGVHVYGGPTDDWGSPRTVAAMNSVNFGALIETQKIGGSAGTLSIDRIRVKVYFTLPGVIHTRAFGVPQIRMGVSVPSVVHTRAFGTTVVSVGSVSITVPSVVHTRAIGTVVVSQTGAIIPPSVIHARAFGIPSVSGPGSNPAIKQNRIAMLDDWQVEGFQENPREQT